MATPLIDDFLRFLGASPTPFHAVENIKSLLVESGFSELEERASWNLERPGKYFVVRGASIVAFTLNNECKDDTHFKLVGAHTDSPCLKVKPSPDKSAFTYKQLGIEVYGGVLLNPWFDRDLSIAGSVSYLSGKGELESSLIDFKKAIAMVPSLAIHLDRSANDKRSVNPQKDMSPILFNGEGSFDFRELLKSELKESGKKDVDEILDFNLCFYDTHKPSLLGVEDQFIAGARLDNLLSCYAGIKALVNCDDPGNCVVVCNDHEEVGSRSNTGAQGTMLSDILARIVPEPELRQRAIRGSLMLSADNAHGIHPNYPSVHDEQHGPILNKGPVVKYDANQSYATNNTGASWVRWLAKSLGEEIPLQSYVTRADMRCGSTIGPITAAALGMQVVDLGVPTFAMHSIREIAGADDLGHLVNLFDRFFQSAVKLDL